MRAETGSNTDAGWTQDWPSRMALNPFLLDSQRISVSSQTPLAGGRAGMGRPKQAGVLAKWQQTSPCDITGTPSNNPQASQETAMGTQCT